MNTIPKVRCDKPSARTCPSRTNCHRYAAESHDVPPAALNLRREPGASACDLYAPINLVTTFAGE